jgi:hypothetical protein
VLRRSDSFNDQVLTAVKISWLLSLHRPLIAILNSVNTGQITRSLLDNGNTPNNPRGGAKPRMPSFRDRRLPKEERFRTARRRLGDPRLTVGFHLLLSRHCGEERKLSTTLIAKKPEARSGEASPA